MAAHLHIDRATLGRVAGVAVVAAIAAGPLYLSEFRLQLVALGLAYGLFAFGLDIAWGRAGIVSIGHALFFGIGCYGVAIAIERGQPGLLGGAAGVVGAALTGALIAAVGTRRGTNPSTMAVLTLTGTLLATQIAISWTSFTGGSTGILFLSERTPTEQYVTVAAVTAAVVGVVWAGVLRRPLGNRLTALRLDEQRAEHLGVAVGRDRVVAFSLSAAVAAIAGALAAPLLSTVGPGQVGILLSTQVLVWVAVGGQATLLGPICGAVAATYGQDALAGTLTDSYLLVLGALFVLSVLFMPQGAAGLLRSGRLIADVTPRGRSAQQPTPPDLPVLAAEGVVKRFDGNVAVDGVTLRVAPAEIVCLIGPNGAGKTTLLNVLSGVLPIDSGAVSLAGQAVTRATSHERAIAGIGRTFQVPRLFPGLTVAEHLILARQQAGARVELPAAYARLERDHAEVVADELSLGDRRSLETAMALCLRPRVLLLDEPAAGLAHEESAALASTLRGVRDQLGCAIVVVEHDMDIVRQLADRVVCLHRGRVIADGTMDVVAGESEVRTAYLGVA